PSAVIGSNAAIESRGSTVTTARRCCACSDGAQSSDSNNRIVLMDVPASRFVIRAKAGTSGLVIPAKAGTHLLPSNILHSSHPDTDNMDSRFRWNDDGHMDSRFRGNDDGQMDSQGADKSAPYSGNDELECRRSPNDLRPRRAQCSDHVGGAAHSTDRREKATNRKLVQVCFTRGHRVLDEDLVVAALVRRAGSRLDTDVGGDAADNDGANAAA